MADQSWPFDAMQTLLDKTREEKSVPQRWDIKQEHLDALKAAMPEQWEAAFGGVPYEVVDNDSEGVTLLVAYRL